MIKNVALLENNQALQARNDRLIADKELVEKRLADYEELNKDISQAHAIIEKLRKENKEIMTLRVNLDLKKKELETSEFQLNVAQTELNHIK